MKKIKKILLIISPLSISALLCLNFNANTKSISKLNSEHHTSGDNTRYQRYNFASGLIGSDGKDACNAQKFNSNQSLNHRKGGNNMRGQDGTETFMFSYENAWFSSNPNDFPGKGGAKGDQSDLGIPIVINRCDGIQTSNLNFQAVLNADEKTKAHPGVFKDMDGDGNYGWEGNYNTSIRQHHNVEKGLYYYIYAIGDKFNMPNLERMSAFNANLGNKIDGEISLPETCCIIGNYAFYNAKPTGSSTLNLPKNINWLGNYAFGGCSFYDINFDQNDISKVNNITFSKPTWKPELLYVSESNRGYVWIPYQQETQTIVEDGVSYQVTDLMKAYHDANNFGFKYKDMKNGAKIKAPVLPESVNGFVNNEISLSADMGAIDPNIENNIVTWTSSNSDILFLDETDNTWKQSIQTSFKTHYDVKVKSSSVIDKESITATVIDNHEVALSSTCLISTDYAGINKFEWENSEDIEQQSYIFNQLDQVVLNVIEDSKYDETTYKQGGKVTIIPGNDGGKFYVKEDLDKISKGLYSCSIRYNPLEMGIGTYSCLVKVTSNALDETTGKPIEIIKKITVVIKYDEIVDFKFIKSPSTIELITGEEKNITYSIRQTSKHSIYKKGISYKLETMENDNSLPTWLSLTNSYVDTDDDGVKDQFSTTIKISKDNKPGVYSFRLTATCEQNPQLKITQKVTLKINEQPKSTWWIWLLVAVGVSAAIVGGIIGHVCYRKDKMSKIVPPSKSM